MHHCKNNGRNFDSLSPEHLTGCTLWLKKRVFNPAASSNIALRLKINIFNPKYSLHTPFQGLSGIKSRLSEPTAPSRCRLLGLQVRSRSAQHSVLSRTTASRSPLQPFGSACPSTRSGCAVPCGPSRSQARVPSLPGPANPAPSAPGEYQLRHS